MVIVRNNFNTGLNLDSSYYQLPPTSYVDALNISRNSIDTNSDNVITNVVGNRIVTFSLPTGTNKCIGAFSYPLRDAVYFFNYNSNGNHGIYEFILSTRTITKVLENLTDTGSTDILGFTQTGKINSVNIYPRSEGDLLFFLDSLGRPTGFNITTMKAGTYTPVTRAIIDVLVAPPLTPPSAIYGNDTNRRTNNFRNKMVRLAYRWTNDDYEKTSCSPISTVPLPVSVLDDTYTSVVTNNNVLNCSFNSGAKNIAKVEILVSFKQDNSNEWGGWQLVESYDKASNSIADDTDFAYAFYNDSNYPYIDETEDPIQHLFDWVPDAALSQELANGNILVYAGVTEGYTNTVVPNVVNVVTTFAAGGGAGSGTLGVVNSFSASNGLGTTFNDWTFSGIPAVGTVINITVKQVSGGATISASTYTTVVGDTVNNVVAGLVANESAPFLTATQTATNIIRLSILEAVYDVMPNGLRSTVTITTPSTSLTPNSIPAWKWSSERSIGIAYFDQHGKTNGIVYHAKISFPAYLDDVSNNVYLPTINTKVYHVPPSWAYSYQFYFTKDPTWYIYWATAGVNIDETDYVYFDVTSFNVNAEKQPTTATNLSYTFQDGDRMRLIKPIGTTAYFQDTFDAQLLGKVVEPTINGVKQTGKTFLKIKKTSPFTNAVFTPNNQVYMIEIYRPAQQAGTATNQPYFEFGRQYPILNPTTATRVHGGQVTDQSTNYVTPAEFNFAQGDSYFRRRSIFISIDPASGSTSSATFFCEDRNFVDIYPSAVSSFDGRPNKIDVDAKTATYGATLRFGQAYQPNTNINGLNRFYQNNLEDVDLTYGNIMRLKARDRFMRIFQQFKVGRMPLYNQLVKTDTGTVSVVSDKLLNPVVYDIGDFGIGDQPESLASHDYADYFTSNIKGAILRVSNDGVNNISEAALVDSWATENIPLRTGSSHVYGAFDQRLGKYIIALEAATGSDAQTLSFDTKFKSFDSFLSYQPEMMCTLGVTLITFKNGSLYTHDSTTYNNFFGVQYDSYITIVANDNPLFVKSFMALEEQTSNGVWTCPAIGSNLYSYGTTYQSSNLVSSDFEQKEGKWVSAILGDINSLSGNVYNGDSMRGNWLTVKFLKSAPTNLVSLNAVTIRAIDSPLNPNRN